MTIADRKLVFVYNADSGLFNTLTDIAHKLLSPHTYNCQLCAITHGTFRVHRQWTDFIQSLGVECEFLHRDEFTKLYRYGDVELPAVFTWQSEKLSLCMAAEEINGVESIQELQQLVMQKVKS